MDLSSVKAGIASVKKALGKADGAANTFRHYLVRRNRITASDANVTVSSLVNWDADLLVPAEEFEAVVNRLPGDATTKLDGGVLTLRSGRFSGTVRTLSADAVAWDDEPKGLVQIELKPDFLEKFKKVASFIEASDDSSWMTSVNVANGKLITTNRGQAMCVTDVPEFEGTLISIPKRAADLIVSRPAPERVLYSGSGATFFYPDGTWLRTGLIAGELPKILFTRLAEIVKPEFEISAEWKAVYERVSALSGDEILIYANRMTGGNEKVTAEDYAESPIPKNREYSSWNPKILTKVVENARWFDPSTYPNPAPFWCEDGTRGLVVGRMI